VGVIRSTVYFEELVTKTATELSLVVRVTDLGFDAEDDPILYQSPHWSNIKGAVVSKVVSLPNRDWQVRPHHGVFSGTRGELANSREATP